MLHGLPNNKDANSKELDHLVELELELEKLFFSELELEFALNRASSNSLKRYYNCWKEIKDHYEI